MEKVTLRNTERRTFCATYYPSVVGRRCKDRLYDVKRARSASGKLIGIKQPHSFSILPLESAEVHAVALHLPQVKAARKAGWLVLEKKKVAAPPAASATGGSTTAAAPAMSAAPAESNGGRRRRGK